MRAILAEKPISKVESDHGKTMKYYDDVSHMIGHTPLVMLRNLNPYPGVALLAKIESYNPGGSVKDRIAKYMIDDAINRGVLTKDKTVIEATSGNTGIGIAMMCAVRGYNCELVMPESMSIERRKIMEAYGATVTLISEELGIDGAQDYVNSKLKEYPDRYFSPDQFDNPMNWTAHYQTTAQEIFEDTDGKITHFVAGLGTSGTLMGVARGLKEKNSAIEIVSVEPESGDLIQGLKDLKTQYIPGIFNETLLDKRIFVDRIAAVCSARDLASREGIFAGQSAGAALAGALLLARSLSLKGVKNAVVVVLFADSGYKYLSGDLFSAEAQDVCVCSSTVF